MHQYCVLLTMCCSLTENESGAVRGTTQNISSGEAGIVLHCCLHCNATILPHWFKSSASTAGLLFNKSNTCISTKILWSAFVVYCAACLFPLLRKEPQTVHTLFHQLHTCQTVINESNSNVEQPRSPSCLRLERGKLTACSCNPQSGGKETFTSGTAVNTLPHYTVARWLQCINLCHMHACKKSGSGRKLLL